MYVRSKNCTAVALALGALSFTASAIDPIPIPTPVFWTWGEPTIWDPVDHLTHIIPMVKVYTVTGAAPGTYQDPDDIALDTKDLIEELGLETGPICILLKALGNGDAGPYDAGPPETGNKNQNAAALFNHWCDALPDEDNEETDGQGDCRFPDDGEICSHWWYTPWMSSGVDELEDWMVGTPGFLPTFQSYVSAEDIVPPVRFHFDTEKWPLARGTYSGMAAFIECQNEDRWGTSGTQGETVCGYGDDMYGLFDIYDWSSDDEWEFDGEDVDDFDDSKGWDADENKPWVNWYQSLLFGTCDAAMEEGIYEYIWGMRTASAYPWEDVMVSNYLSSVRVTYPRHYTHRKSWGADDFFKLRWEGKADLQAPVFYQAAEEHDPGHTESVWETTMRVHRDNLDAIIGSLGGSDASEITPWIPNISVTLEGHEVDKDDMRELLTMLRGRKVQEYIVWQNDQVGGDGVDTDDWNALKDVINQVWMYQISSASATTGTSGDDEDDMEFASDDLSFDATSALIVLGTSRVIVDVVFDDNQDYDEADPPGDSSLKIRIEGLIESAHTDSVTFDVDIWNNEDAGSWESVLDAGDLGDTTEVFYLDVDDDNNTDFISDADEVKIRITAEYSYLGQTSFTLKLDEVSLAEAGD